ncbi:hypothetical protein BpHYR1_049226 [Brachionus plicatilis]|uniref:Uncharacterized protein n=1 Tax=Brachionus plicatilis TaxID=10195 RepID=A0A3M7RXA5_BRAPC|nr:hypothetical protein BpHYR1_049226 [Brachionus plicatilis]
MFLLSYFLEKNLIIISINFTNSIQKPLLIIYLLKKTVEINKLPQEYQYFFSDEFYTNFFILR